MTKTERATRYRERCVANGKCVDCGIPTTGRYCPYHRKMRLQYLADHRAKARETRAVLQARIRTRQLKAAVPSKDSLLTMDGLMGGLI